MFEIKPYEACHKAAWDDFVDHSRNGTFLFRRDYMDYHSDRFRDGSLMVCRKGKLYALLPGNIAEDTFYSHQGLTYGGLVMSAGVTVAETVGVFEFINCTLRERGIKRVVYKAVPHIYHSIPSEEDIYALFRNGARMTGCNISSAIYRDEKIKFNESRKSGIRKAERSGFSVEESEDFGSFWKILNDNLNSRYGVDSVHSLEEIRLLKERFPENIKLYGVMSESKMVAGTVVYLTARVAHTQYISTGEEGRASGALDLLFSHLINKIYVDWPVFDFGQSTEDMGNLLNENLIFQKEGFGGRGIAYNIYEYNL